MKAQGHHRDHEKPDGEEGEELTGDDREEAEANNEAARLWINGLKIVAEKLGLQQVLDLSATPFLSRAQAMRRGRYFRGR